MPAELARLDPQEGIDWLNSRLQALNSREVRPEAAGEFAPPFQEAELDRYEMSWLERLARERFYSPELLTGILDFYCNWRQWREGYKKEFRYLFPLVESSTRDNVSARDDCASYYRWASCWPEADYLSTTLVAHQAQLGRTAATKIEHYLDLLQVPSDRREKLGELLRTEAGISKLASFEMQSQLLASCRRVRLLSDTPRLSDREALARMLLRPMLLALRSDGVNVDFGPRTEPDKAISEPQLAPYIEVLELTALEAGLPAGTLDPLCCNRCGERVGVFKHGSICWDCWGD